MLLLGIDSAGKVKKNEFVFRAGGEMSSEGYPVVLTPVYRPGDSLEAIVQRLLDFVRANTDVSRVQLICMLNGCDRKSTWLKRRAASWALIWTFARYLHDRQIMFSCILGGDATMFDGLGPDFTDVQNDIIAMFRQLGCCTYTGMEPSINYGWFRGKLHDWHIQDAYKQEAV